MYIHTCGQMYFVHITTYYIFHMDDARYETYTHTQLSNLCVQDTMCGIGIPKTAQEKQNMEKVKKKIWILF